MQKELLIVIKCIVFILFSSNLLASESYICVYLHEDTAKDHNKYKKINNFIKKTNNQHSLKTKYLTIHPFSKLDESIFYVKPKTCKKLYFRPSFVDNPDNSLWVQDILIHAHNLLSDDGVLYFPIIGFYNESISIKKNHLSKLLDSPYEVENKNIFAKIKEFFKSKKREWIKFKKTKSIPYKKSTFKFMLDHFDYSRNNLKLTIHSLHYMSLSAARKANSLNKIIKTYKIHPESILDIGGGFGLLVLGLSFEQDSIKRMVVVDILESYKRLHGTMKSYYNLDNFLYVNTRMEKYDFAEKFDLITFMNSILLVDKKHHYSIMKKAWDALHPGGLLIVNENVNYPNMKVDRITDKQFTATELDNLLHKFSKNIRYFTYFAVPEELSFKDVNNQSLMRVIQKPIII